MSGKSDHTNKALYWHKWGRGKELLLCFHGYGESGADFAFLAEILGSRYTLLAPDLPLHGDTGWKEAPELEPAVLWNWIDEKTGGASFSLLGFSMGGRVCLQLLQEHPERINKMVLLAPDGLHRNFWYRLATQTEAGNRLFRQTMNRPGWLLNLVNAAGSARLINRSVAKFVRHYLGSPEYRQALYRRWTMMRLFRPDLPALRSVIRRHQKEITLVFGRYDRIILAKRGENFALGLSARVHVLQWNAGHQLLAEKHAPAIAALL